jgi:2-octaprenyl-6-methoxyphenol hydroxylase
MALKSVRGSIGTFDAVIIGGGMTGLILAAALGNAGIAVSVIERSSRETLLNPTFDGRTTAIAAGSRNALSVIGAWERMQEKASNILDIRISDGLSPLFLHFDHADLNEGPLGYIVENRIIRAGLITRLDELPNVELNFGCCVTTLERGEHFVEVGLNNGKTSKASIAIATDGRGSPTRQAAEIGVKQWRYPQIGIVCTVKHEGDHHGVAQEHFLPAGPFAILPMTGGRSSIVWTEKETLAPSILDLTKKEFTEELTLRFGDYLGQLKIIDPIFSYPLGFLHADRYIMPRLALAGEAAHAIHPIAGQGLNISIQDVAVLAEVITEAVRLGVDPGSVNVLEAYEQRRRFENTMMLAATDGLNRLFSNDITPIRIIRDMGLAMVNKTPPLKRLLMRQAMGVLGDLPRLIRGEKI